MDIVLNAKDREQTGKAVKSLRRQGQVPAVVYGRGKDPVSLQLDAKELEKVYAKVGTSKIIGLKVGEGKSQNVLIQDVQQDVRNGAIIHTDFYAVRMDEKLRTEVPLHFTGESTAVYQLEGTLIKNLETVEVEALPSDLPESIEVDISGLDDFEKSIHVRDLPVPSGVELLEEADELVAKVEPPRSEEEMAELDSEITEELPEGAEEGESAEAGAEPEAEAAAE